MLVKENRPQGVSDIARSLKITRSRAFRILKTLEARGYVEFDTAAKGYRLGLKLLQMWGGLYQQLDLRRVVEPFLRELAEETGDVALLLVLNDKAAVCIDRYQGNYMLQFATPIGVSIPLHMGASPKLLLAYLPEPEREQLIDEMELTAMTPYTITDRQELRRRLQQIRTQGYSIDEQDYELGVYAIGAPVRDHTGRVVAGITVATPDVRWDEARKQALIRLVVETAGKISGRLRYSENPSNGVLASF